MKEVVEVLARALVDQPDEVQVGESPRGDRVVRVELVVAQSDLGKVIGRHGRIASAIRTIASAAGAKQNKRVSVDINP